MPSHSAVTQLLSDLVSIPSINPSLLPTQSNLTGEEQVATFLADYANKLGIEVQRQAVLPRRKNILLRLKPKKKIKQRVLLTPHLDVVPAEESAFRPKIKNGKLHGRGACDTKGSVAAFFQAFYNLAKNGPLPNETEIIFIGLVDEEFGQAGSRKLAKIGPKADLAIAGEPTELKVVTAHKGNIWLQLETTGKAAHGATPHHGKNAIHLMIPILKILFEEYPKILRTREHPLLGSPTLNIGQISGGSQPNIVADRCIIDLDRRTIPGESEESVKLEIQALFRKQKLPTPTFSLSRSVPCPPLDTDSNFPMVQSFLRATGKRKTHGVPYFTDASPISMGGTPALVFGPGNIAQAHAKDEFIEIKQLEKAQAIVEKFLKGLV
ncbi:MAG: M20 family metallopeptidase [Opitutae bacterium]|mgnify:FL=1|nr:M20 family metallopeptidase [Opitutae bacterium]